MNFNRGSLSVYLYKPIQNPDRPPCSLIYRRYLHPAKAAYYGVLSILPKPEQQVTFPCAGKVQ